MHTDQPCHACGVQGPLENYQARAHVDRLRMRWGADSWGRW